MLLFGTSTLTGCGPRAQADEDSFSIREPQPTFTPTPPSALEAQSNATSGGSAAAVATQSNTANLEQPTARTGSNSTTSTGAASSSAASSSAGSTSAETSTESDAVRATAPDEQAAAVDVNAASAAAVGRVVVNTPLVNGREGPSTDYPVVGIVGRGEEYDVIGRNAAGDWWNVCCFQDEPFWIIDELVDAVGAVDIGAVPVTEPGAGNAAVAVVATATPPAATESTAADASAPAATATPAQPAATPTLASASSTTGDFPFDLQLQEQFAETDVVRIYLYVYSEDTQALEGYSLRVTKDGTELPVSEISFGPQAGFTWPVAEPRQRFQNLKVEFPGEAPAGVWTVQLIDGGGNAVGPVATFELANNDPQQELYVRYEQR
jgi:uncharacterized protein YraI